MDWLYKNKEIKSLDDLPDKTMFILYKITNLTKNKDYYGYKKLFNITNPETTYKRWLELRRKDKSLVTRTKNKKESKKQGKPVWRYKRANIRKESDWKSYTGSSDKLNKDIENGDEYEKKILKCFEKGKDAKFAEIELLFQKEVLRDCDCYNSNILGRYFNKVDC